MALDRWQIGLSCGCLSAMGYSFLTSPANLPDWCLCPSMRFLGLPCPGCGLTRSFCAISHGAFHQAWDFNPFGYVFYLMALGCLLFPIISYFAPNIASKRLPSGAVFWFMILLVAAMWTHHLLRLFYYA